MSTMFGIYTTDGYTIYLHHDGQTREIYRCQTPPFGTPEYLGLLEIGRRCERIGMELANERGVEWTGCRFDEDEDNSKG